ncbi:unnamed protein product [Auanema sp. JU1783]|nr:unnamed protein product [Auanema sp. JU1783]
MLSSRKVLNLFKKDLFANVRNASSKKGLRKPKRAIALPPQYLTQLKLWPELLQEEINYADQKIAEKLDESTKGMEQLGERGLMLSFLKYSHINNCPVKGKITVFQHQEKSYTLPKFRIGTPVMLCPLGKSEKVAEGIMMTLNSQELQVKFTKKFADFQPHAKYCLFPSNHTGSSHSLKNYIKNDFSESFHKSDLFLYSCRGLPMPSIHNDKVHPNIDTTLDQSQRRAVAAALNNKRPFVCIRGPPGTGKTRVIAEIVRLLTQKRQKVLVCAPTHVAVQNAIDKTMSVMNIDETEEDEAVERIEEITNALSHHDEYFELENIMEEIVEAKKQGYSDVYQQLQKKAARLKRKILSELHTKRDVIFSTIGSSAIYMLENYTWHPDVVIIDEAGQCTEPSVLPAISRARRCVLVGDEMQLPPVVLSPKAKDAKLHVSLLERLVNEFPNNNIVFQLNVQYRMNKEIMRWSSNQFYNSTLVAAENVSEISVKDISNISEDHPAIKPFLLINTDSFREPKYNERRAFDSYENSGEAGLVTMYVKFLLNQGIDSSRIGVITPYFGQARVIKRMLDLSENLLVSSVDAFQGNEKDVIIFSLVRNNRKNQIGFLRDYRRLNVAITRAKRQFVLIGSAEMLQSDKMMKSLFQDFKQHGEILGSTFVNNYL